SSVDSTIERVPNALDDGLTGSTTSFLPPFGSSTVRVYDRDSVAPSTDGSWYDSDALVAGPTLSSVMRSDVNVPSRARPSAIGRTRMASPWSSGTNGLTTPVGGGLPTPVGGGLPVGGGGITGSCARAAIESASPNNNVMPTPSRTRSAAGRRAGQRAR